MLILPQIMRSQLAHHGFVFSLRQYMSAIFYHDEEQKLLAEKTLKEKQTITPQPIKTSILPFKTFYEAEK